MSQMICKTILLLWITLLISSSTFAASKNEDADLAKKINLCTSYIVEHKYDLAAQCFLPFAIQGESHAQFNLGMLYEQGNGVTQSFSDAFMWYQKSAAQGYSFSEAKVGEMYVYGVGVTQHCKKGLYWIEKAAAQNNRWAFEDLYKLYSFGRCVESDPKKAQYWYEKLKNSSMN